MNAVNILPFNLRAWIGEKLAESFYRKLGKKLVVKTQIYHGTVDIEWAYIGDRKRDTLVFLHGFADRKENFYFASKILGREFDVIIPDMPGFGRSTVDSKLKYSYENYGKWLGEFIEYIGIDSFHLAGNSMGGAVCTILAAKYPEKIKSLSLIDTAGFYKEGTSSVYDEALKGQNLFQVETVEDYEIFRDRVFYKKPVLPDLVREFMIKIAMDNRNWYGKIFNELADMDLIRTKEKTMEELSLNSLCKDIRMKTMVFWGKHDTLFPYEIAEFIKGKISGSGTHIFRDLGHCPHLEDSEGFARELADFIRSVQQE